MQKYLQNARVSRILFAACWFAYAAAYAGRISYYTALTGMMSGCGFTKPEAGLIGTAFFFCYGCGQIGSGALGDRVSPFKMVLGGLVLSAAANFAVGLSRSAVLMSVIWGLNGLAQSMLWSPILYIFVHILHPGHRRKACLYVTASAPAGTVCTYLVSMVLLKYANWNAIFLTGSVVLLLAAALWGCVSLYSSRFLAEGNAETGFIQTENNAEKTGCAPPVHLTTLLLSSGGAVMLLAVLIHGMLKEGVSVWVPTMISETYRVSSSLSVFLAAFLPVVSLIGPYLIDRIYEMRLGRDEVKAAATCLVSAVPPLCALLFIGTLPVWACVSLLALLSVSMNAFNYIAVTMIPVRFSGFRKTSAATGLFNSVTYMGCALSTYGFGLLSERFGWNFTVGFWMLLAVSGVAVCFCASCRWRNFLRRRNREEKGCISNE